MATQTFYAGKTVLFNAKGEPVVVCPEVIRYGKKHASGYVEYFHELKGKFDFSKLKPGKYYFLNVDICLNQIFFEELRKVGFREVYTHATKLQMKKVKAGINSVVEEPAFKYNSAIYIPFKISKA